MMIMTKVAVMTAERDSDAEVEDGSDLMINVMDDDNDGLRCWCFCCS